MKNIVAIVGSLRKDSVNRAVFNAYSELSKDHFKLTEVSIADFPLYSGDLSEPESVTQAAQAIKESDGLIFFSPEYNYSIPGVLKNAIDWLSLNKEKPFNAKPAAIIGASPGGIATARMQYHLRQVCVYLNLSMLNKPEVMIGAAFDKVVDNKLQHEDTLSFLASHVDAYHKFIG